jgi:NADH dehydrogenase
MRIAITGATGFVGRHLAHKLAGHAELQLISRGVDTRDNAVFQLPDTQVFQTSVADSAGLDAAFAGCDAVAHCAGINREIREQTYDAVHVQGTRNVVAAAKRQGVKKLILISFLRARPDCGSGYHESKWAAEEIVRASGLDYTVLKAGVIYGQGDHMLDHLSHAFHTFPLFGLVGLSEKLLRPTAIADMVEVIEAALMSEQLSRRTLAVTGPEEISLRTAVKQVAGVVGKQPLCFRMPVWVHYGLAIICERLMTIPPIARGVRILSEGVVEPGPLAEPLPAQLQPSRPFSTEQIRAGLPKPKSFGIKDLRCPCSCFAG